MRARMSELGRALWTPLVLTAALAVLIYGAPALSPSLQPSSVQMMVNLIIVVGLFVFVGGSGVISFGHIAFMALGAYTSALLTIPPQTKHLFLPNLPGFLAHAHLGTFSGIVLAAVVAGLFGLIVGMVLMRLVGIAAGIATFAVLVIVNTIASNWTNVTGAENPLVGIPATTSRAVALLVCAIVMVCAALFTESRAGLRLRASREDEIAARAIGVNVWRDRVLAFTLSAACVGVGGAMYSGFIGSFNADAFYLDATILTLAMLVVGGTRSLTGAWVGTVVISAIIEFLRRLSTGMSFGPLHVTAPAGTEQVGLGICLLLILLIRPSGLTGGKDVPGPRQIVSWVRRDNRRDVGPPDPESTTTGEEPSGVAASRQSSS
jgi:branched-chain amino acid transport system permease protein